MLSLLGMLSLLFGCAVPVAQGARSVALSLEEARATRLGQALAPQLEAHPGQNGIYALADPHEAFAARVLLARAAERTLDAQYYIWHGDITGILLLEELLKAAERGVRVRLLLDDNGTSGLDYQLAALARHPNIQVRLFNPFANRQLKWLGYLTDFRRANRRMHNKSFTADSQATIVGGRNIGDEYFGATEGLLFVDLDVLSVGPIVADVSADFDRYWASASSYPVEQVLPEVPATALQELTQKAALTERDAAAASYVNAVSLSDFIPLLTDGDLPMVWAPARMVSDDPAKGLGLAEPEGLLSFQLDEVLGVPRKSVVLISPYFVPTEDGVDAFAALAARGVDVRILTNSLHATDVAAVHAGYAKRRKDLLKAGIRLYEMRRLSPRGRNESAGPLGSSASSLHAKVFAVDDEHLFVGSFNFDPRSANLNTELGFVIDSPELATTVRDAFSDSIPLNAYEVRLDEKGKLYWLKQEGDEQLYYRSEPHVGFLKRGFIYFLSKLPIEGLL